MPNMQHAVEASILVIFAATLPIDANKIDTHINTKGCGESEASGRIFNGQPATRESIPWIVELMSTHEDGTFHCGASIITSNIVLTAAHCLKINGMYPKRVHVFFNSTTSFRGAAIFAEKIMLHPRFAKKGEMVYDVALMKLAVDLKFSRRTKPVCVPEKEVDVAEKSLLVAGWGVTEPEKDSEVLLRTQLRGIRDEDCQHLIKKAFNPATKRYLKPGPMVCANGSNTGACKGDSGGPLTLKVDERRSVQVGIASFILGDCTGLAPTVFSRVAFHLPWIKRMLRRPRRWRKLEYDRHINLLVNEKRSRFSSWLNEN